MFFESLSKKKARGFCFVLKYNMNFNYEGLASYLIPFWYFFNFSILVCLHFIAERNLVEFFLMSGFNLI